MKNKIFLIFIIFFPLFLYSCGNKDIDINKNTTKVSKKEISTSLVKWDKILIAYVKNITWVVTNAQINTKLKVWDILYIWDIIETNSNSEITMVMSDHSIFRLNSDSKFIFESIEWNNTNINLVKWSLWGRVLKSITSEEVINISNNWVTAAIIWTSVLFEAWKDTSKKPKISVIDSFSETAGKEWIKINDNKNNEYKVLPEQYMDLNKTPKVSKMSRENKINLQVIDNSKKDLIYMTQIFEENSNIKDWVSEKIIWEIGKTIPEKSEVNDFFNNKEIVDSTSSWINNISELLIKDDIISNLKVEMKNIGINKQDSVDFIDDIIQENYTSEWLSLNDIIVKYNDGIKELSKKIEKDYSANLNTTNISKSELLQLAQQNLEDIKKASEELMNFTDIQVNELRLKGIKIEGDYNQKKLDLKSSTNEKILKAEIETNEKISKIKWSTNEKIKYSESNTQQEIIKIKTDIAERMEIVEKQIRSEIFKLKQEYDNKIISLKNQINISENEKSTNIKSLSNKLGNDIEILNKDYDSKITVLENQISVVDDKRYTEINTLADKLDKEIDTLWENYDNIITNLEAWISLLYNEREDKIDGLEDKLGKDIDTLEEDYDNKISFLENQIDTLEDEKSTKIDELENKLDKEIDVLEEEQYARINKSEDEIDVTIDNIENSLYNTIDEYNNLKDNSIDDLENDLDNNIDIIEDKIDEELDIIDDTTYKIIDEAEEKTENAIDKAEDYIDDIEYMD